ncbi:hypothetical protein HK100_004155 [Physocladia obscura]|uniref:Uncharacterized protein n=1 Tax=Physocladia obscura TaxID=109957 RepID=A0AAD5SUR0_9FUNG|nr:hypothetical protein HK100_004155 [Physocladia obscura]
MISNLMLYILSVHADVTINRQGPRKAKGKKKKGSKKKKSSLRKSQQNPDSIEAAGNGTSSDQIQIGSGPAPHQGAPLIVLDSNGHQRGNGSNNGELVGELSEYTERRRRGSRTGSDRSSISSAGSGSSYGSSASESDRDDSGGGLFGRKKKDGGSSAVGMVLNLFGMGRAKKASITADQDEDDLPLASLQKKH